MSTRVIWGLVLIAGAARMASAEEGATPARRDAAQVTRDGSFLPTTLSARVGDQRALGIAYGGYDSSPGQGAIMAAAVEAAISNRVALRVGVNYLSPTNEPSPSATLRVGVLRQERYGVDIGVAATYNRRGFTEAKGEFELALLVARRWNRLGVFGNVVYGQGVDPGERDAEMRAAALYAIGEHLNVGLDARARLDLGGETPGRVASKLESDFDLLAGPLVTYAAGPVMLLAQAGVHSRVQHEQPLTGFAAIGGLGASF